MPQKLDQHSNPTRKALTLFSLLLFTGKSYSLKQLAAILSCSRQSVLRLIEQIELSGEGTIEKWQELGQNWYRIKAPLNRPKIALCQHEIEHLVMCRDILKHVLPIGISNSLEKTTQKAAVLLDDLDKRPEALNSIAQSNFKGAIDYSRFEAILEALIIGIKKRQVLEIAYDSPNSLETKTHEIVPVRIVSFREALYIRAWQVNATGVPRIRRPITLALQRIKNLHTTIRILPDQAEKDVEMQVESGFFGIAITDKPFRVQARFYLPVANYVKERIWSQDQDIIEEEQGQIILHFTAQSELEVVKWILGFGQEAELLQPAHLRKQVQEELRTTLGRYR